MSDKSLNANIVSYLKGEFIDYQSERDYLIHDMKRTKRFLMPLLLFFGVLYFLFIIPDYFNLGQTSQFLAVFINRFLVFILILILYIKLKKADAFDFFYRWIAVYQMIIFASFLFTLLSYENPNILIQTFGMMLIVISLFLVPSRWLTTFLISLVYIFAFYIISGLLGAPIDAGERLASLIFLLIVLIISGVSSLRTNYYKRVQYDQEQKLLVMSMTDPLTGSFNRIILNSEFNDLFNPNITHPEATVILFDLDDFKKVNDQYGHLYGDNVLVELVQLFKPLMNEKSSLVRWGGEEFMVYLKDASLKEGKAFAEKLKARLANHLFENNLTITCSFGVASSKECKSLNELLNKVDVRMYQAKSLGKNRIVSA